LRSSGFVGTRKFEYELENSVLVGVSLEKHIKISTQGRLTIPKQIRDSLRISDGQAILVKSNLEKREIVIVLQPSISDYK